MWKLSTSRWLHGRVRRRLYLHTTCRWVCGTKHLFLGHQTYVIVHYPPRHFRSWRICSMPRSHRALDHSLTGILSLPILNFKQIIWTTDRLRSAPTGHGFGKSLNLPAHPTLELTSCPTVGRCDKSPYSLAAASLHFMHLLPRHLLEEPIVNLWACHESCWRYVWYLPTSYL